MKIISYQYYLIQERDMLAVYDIKSQKVDKLIPFPQELMKRIIELNNFKIQISDDKITKQLMEKIEIIMPNIFIEVDCKMVKEYIACEDFIEDYVQNHMVHYTIKEHMLRINLRHALYFKTYNIYTHKSIEQLTYFMNVKQCKSFDEDVNVCHLFDLSYFNKEVFVAIEKFCFDNNVQRIYYGETIDSIIVGPMLIGKDYGCRYCNDIDFDCVETSEAAGKLIFSLLQYELMHYDNRMLSFSNDDKTLCKGKYFQLSKAGFEGKDHYINRKSKCLVCGGLYD